MDWNQKREAFDGREWADGPPAHNPPIQQKKKESKPNQLLAHNAAIDGLLFSFSKPN